MACGLPGIASGIGIDPTLPRDGTDFMTLQGVMRIGSDSVGGVLTHTFGKRRLGVEPSLAHSLLSYFGIIQPHLK